ncbi:hypothetical protein ABPG74_020596 [Tetrahymena malaccensis]
MSSQSSTNQQEFQSNQQANQHQTIPEYVAPQQHEQFKQTTDIQIAIKEAYKEKSAKYANFFNDYTNEYKLLKKITHECQVKCYANEALSIKESESCARSCLRPYLTFKKITGEKLQNCEDLFQREESKCTSVNLDTKQCYAMLTEKLATCLKQNAGFYAKTYAKIFKEFDSIVEY